MPAIRGITVAVGDWYAKTLEICLPRNMRHLESCLVVTTPQDDAVKAVAAKVPGVRVFETDAFTRHGAVFNKSLALEIGFDVLGREGWILIHDADILLPDVVPFGQMRPGCLHGARRRVLEDASKWHPDYERRLSPMARDGNGPIGFFQCFAADDPAVRDKRPWYDVSFPHAGGGDAAFMMHWPRHLWKTLPVDVLHLGPVDRHWFGVDPAAKDLMAAYVTRNGWRRAMVGLDPAAAGRAGELPGRVQVPGYPASTFVLPFEAKGPAGDAP